ncbi:hypothetical protein FHS27_003721 [Rhodopirellula rubra]|uniref:Uncharacterized protein n=1 Tax=Aporhodopirellula rubra TaxID=980271 RepID=A0A7W5H6X8_9BACT|nr:hypothetical protein [Aporhodopirellula rubra]
MRQVSCSPDSFSDRSAVIGISVFWGPGISLSGNEMIKVTGG